MQFVYTCLVDAKVTLHFWEVGACFFVDTKKKHFIKTIPKVITVLLKVTNGYK